MLSADRSINRGDLLYILVDEYLAANLDAGDTAIVNNPISLAMTSAEALRGGRSIKARYLFRRETNETPVHSWQFLPKLKWFRLRQVAQFARVSPDDLAAAAIFWACGLPEDSPAVSDAPKSYGPLAPPPPPPEAERPPNLTDFQWKMMQFTATQQNKT